MNDKLENPNESESEMMEFQNNLSQGKIKWKCLRYIIILMWFWLSIEI